MGDLLPLSVGEPGSWVPEVRRKEVDRIRDWRLREGWRSCAGLGRVADSSSSSSLFPSCVAGGVSVSLASSSFVSVIVAGGSGSAVEGAWVDPSSVVWVSSFFF